MPKPKTSFLCSACGDDFPKWFGKCPSCGEWGSLSEFKVLNKRYDKSKPQNDLNNLNQVLSRDIEKRVETKLNEIDRVLGGGVLQGSMILLGGSPGVGKSTLSLHLCSSVKIKTLYVSAEESENQIALRAQRLNVNQNDLFLSSENNIDDIISHVNRLSPNLIIIDSIQTIVNTDLDSLPGSPTQVRDCGQRLLEISKQRNISIIIVGHVTKEGSIAGPKMLEHMVDVVLYLEGDDRYGHRVLRSIKNRFGSTNEIGLFKMSERGLEQITNPSKMFLEERSLDIPGTSIYPSLEGTRPILVEVQALVSNNNYGIPQRNVNGYDQKRLAMIIAVLDKRLGLEFSNKDVFVNLVGGLKIDDPAADLAILLAIASSMMDKAIDKETVLLGEVGLAGEIRSINKLEQRLIESSALGFKKAYIPRVKINSNLNDIPIKFKSVKLVKDIFAQIF